jgi:hypothetical protein
MAFLLHDHLRERLSASFHQVERALAGIDEEAAYAGADPGWRRYRFGVGLDGSIAGIVRHLAAWKAIAAEGLETGRFPREDVVGPAGPGWAGLLAWLREGQARLAAALEARDEAALAEQVTFEGERMSVRLLFTHMVEHDQYHAGQVNLLRQLRGQMEEG